VVQVEVLLLEDDVEVLQRRVLGPQAAEVAVSRSLMANRNMW
jgi:ribosomal protein S28E/S33